MASFRGISFPSTPLHKATPFKSIVVVMVVGFGGGGVAGENQIHTCVEGVVGPLG